MIVPNIYRHCFFCLCMLIVSCDSGDIYPTRPEERNTNISVTGRLILKGTTDTENYQLHLAAFESRNDFPVVWTHVTKTEDSDTVTVSLSNIPPSAVNVRLCLMTIGRRAIYDFAVFDISGEEMNVEIPVTEVSMKLKYETIQELFERSTCTACHGSESGGAGLLLGSGTGYTSLVGKPSVNSTKMRVEPFDLSGSFLIDVLTSDTLRLKHPHSSIIYSQDDLNLLKAWIERGAEND